MDKIWPIIAFKISHYLWVNIYIILTKYIYICSSKPEIIFQKWWCCYLMHSIIWGKSNSASESEYSLAVSVLQKCRMTMSLYFTLETCLQNNHSVVIAFHRGPQVIKKKKKKYYSWVKLFGGTWNAYKMQYKKKCFI